MRSVSPEFMQTVLARETSVVVACLLTIDHPDLSTPIRLTNDSIDTTSRGETFLAYPFKITLPDDSDDTQSRAKIIIDNVGRALVNIFRSGVGARPQVTIELVKSTDWDVVEIAITGYIITEVSISDVIECTLNFDSRINEFCPAGRFTPGFFPGVH